MQSLREKMEPDCWEPVYVCVFVSSGKRIPAVDAAGATSGKAFKLGRQASESHRTCCWWCRWLSPHETGDLTFSYPLCARPASAYSHHTPSNTRVFEGVWWGYWGQWHCGQWHRVQHCQPDGRRKCVFAALNNSKSLHIIWKFKFTEQWEKYLH